MTPDQHQRLLDEIRFAQTGMPQNYEQIHREALKRSPWPSVVRRMDK